MSGSDARPIPLRISNKRAYVWDVDDIATIRSKHHLCGILTGTLPHLSQQNVFLGIPLVLMPEEVVLLVENGCAVLVDDPKAHLQPTVSELRSWSAEQLESMKQQIALGEAKSSKENSSSSRAMSEQAVRKRKQREEKKMAEAARVAAAAASEDLTTLISPTPEPTPAPTNVPSVSAESSTSIPIPNALSKTSSSIPYTIVVPAASSSVEWYDPSSCSYSTIDAAREAGVWDYPSNLQERARCGVFRGLWEQGYFLGGGIKFGGEYLVYPGDPLRYHSHFAATVMESPVAALKPMEIVAHGRLGTATKKAHLLCGWDDEKRDVSYLSIEWAGFG